MQPDIDESLMFPVIIKLAKLGDSEPLCKAAMWEGAHCSQQAAMFELDVNEQPGKAYDKQGSFAEQE